MYELSETLSDMPWNFVTEYATASLRAPSGYHDTDVAARLMALGSLSVTVSGTSNVGKGKVRDVRTQPLVYEALHASRG
jgi:hypothetical protein